MCAACAFPEPPPGGKAGVPRGPAPAALRASARRQGRVPRTLAPEGCQHTPDSHRDSEASGAQLQTRASPARARRGPASQLGHRRASSELGDAPSSRGPRSPSLGTPTVLLNVWLPALWAFIFLRLLTKVCSLWWYSAVLYVFWC